jgi:hypothetical protein
MIDITNEVESIYNELGNTLIVTGKDFTILSESGRIVGYCNKYKGIYRVVYPVTGNPEVDDRIKMHEYGHIYLGHLEGIYEDLDRNLLKIIRNKDSQLIDQINKNCGIDYASDILDKVISDPWLNHNIHNIAMDLEVNSTILNKDDLESITENLNQMMFDEYSRLSKNGTVPIDMRKMSNLYSKFDMKGVHPKDFEFNEGLTYPDYLVQIILNLDKVIRMLSNNYNDKDKFSRSMKRMRDENKNEDKNKNSCSSSGGSDQQDDSGDENRNIPKTREEFEEMMRNAKIQDSSSSDESNEDEGDSNSRGGGSSSEDKNEDNKNDTNKSGSSGKESDESDGDHGTDSRKEADDKRKTDLGSYACEGGSGRGLEKSNTVRNYVVNEDPLTIHLKEILRDMRHKVIKRDFSKDMTYKYNRRVLGRDNKMLSPTYRQKLTKSEDPTIAFFVDVSGSMNSSLVDRIITTIRNGMKSINRSLKYSIITWDTELCEYYKDLNFNTPIPKISCGGGTEMAGTFDLFKRDFGIDDIMVLISDFGDSLNDWHKKEVAMNGYSMYGLKYGHDTWYNNGVQPKWKNFKVRQCD